MATIHLCFSPPIPVWKVGSPPIGDGAVQMSCPVLCRVALELCLDISFFLLGSPLKSCWKSIAGSSACSTFIVTEESTVCWSCAWAFSLH